MATSIDKVRVLIPDTEAVFNGGTLFTETEIETYLEIANGSVLRAASYAVYAIATSEAMISKVIKTQDLSTNGAQVAEALHKKAAALAARADKEDDLADAFYFNIIDSYSGHPELTEWIIPDSEISVTPTETPNTPGIIWTTG